MSSQSFDQSIIYQPNIMNLPDNKGCHIASMSAYNTLYHQSISDPETFWGTFARDTNLFTWREPFTKVLAYNFNVSDGPIFVRWFEDGSTNLCYNCLDKHIERGLGSKVAFYWEGNDPHDFCHFTYRDIWAQVNEVGLVLKQKGVKKGDVVAIYMPMIVELVVAVLACSRIGAIHSVVFGGFSAESLSNRIYDGRCRVLLTCDGVWRGSKLIELKSIADAAMEMVKTNFGFSVDTCLVVRHVSTTLPHRFGSKKRLPSFMEESNEDGVSYDEVPTSEVMTEVVAGTRPVSHLHQLYMEEDRDEWLGDLMRGFRNQNCPIEWMGAEDPLFILYTSGSTGKPKGILHTQGGYMVYSAMTFRYSFDYQPDDIYWCTADIGWITGHTYVIYGPMLNGSTSVLFEGIPTWPTPRRFWEIIEKYKVSKFYTAPTALRSLMKDGNENVTSSNRSSLKVLGTVGEPINPSVWEWYYSIVGEGRCNIVDTFWQTETGGHVLTPLPGCTPTKPGSACFPFFGISAHIVNDYGQEESLALKEGFLVFSKPWPGMMRTIFGDHERFETTYFKKFPGFYCTGDGAKFDEDRYIWITGRIDDMLNCSGHLISTAEIESSLLTHESVCEAAVVAKPHDLKGECTYCFVTLKNDHVFSEALKKALRDIVRSKIGPFATPDFLQEAPGLPKTRSGKIMRRILRKIAVNDRHDIGDISTLADPSIVETLFELRPPGVD